MAEPGHTNRGPLHKAQQICMLVIIVAAVNYLVVMGISYDSRQYLTAAKPSARGGSAPARSVGAAASSPGVDALALLGTSEQPQSMFSRIFGGGSASTWVGSMRRTWIVNRLSSQFDMEEEQLYGGRQGNGTDWDTTPSLDASKQADMQARAVRMANEAPFRHYKDRCAELLQIPRVAIMFLTKGELFHENTWKMWFQCALTLHLT